MTEANIVMVLQDAQPPQGVGDLNIAEYMPGPVDIATGPGNLTISSMRAQLEVTFINQRLTVRSHRTTLAQEIVNLALGLCETFQARVRSLGFNFKLRYDRAESDSDDVVKGYLNLDALHATVGESVSSAKLILQFPHGDSRLQVELSTDGPETLVADLNFHFQINADETEPQTSTELGDRRDWSAAFQSAYLEGEAIVGRITKPNYPLSARATPPRESQP